MPIYEYKCKDCGQVSDIFVHKFDDKPQKCPGCGSPDLGKVSTFDAHFYLGGPKAMPKKRKMY